MTTYSTNTRIRQDSDETFREWGSEINTALTTIGLVQTADTGQINWTTVTRAAASSDAGYEIWYMNDSLHSTKPIYIKLIYGSAGTTSRGRLKVEVGTGSDGAGNITGGHVAVQVSTTASIDLTTDVTYPSYWSFTNGCFAFIHKVGRPSADFAYAGIIISRTCGSDGALSDKGFVCVYHHNGNTSSTSVSMGSYNYVANTWTSTTTIQTNGKLGFLPFPIGSSTGADPSGDSIVVLTSAIFDTARPLNNLLLGHTGDFAIGNTASLTPIGATARTYLYIESALGFGGSNAANQSVGGIFVVYE
jgi:hypothetical protein